MKIVVLIKDSHLDNQPELIGHLHKAGIRVIKVEEKAGIISGEAEAPNFRDIESIAGVSHARRD